MLDPAYPTKKVLLRETALFLGLFLLGILLLPMAIYLVGQSVFGDYGGTGFGDFYGRLHYELRSGRGVSWYLVLSPYLCWQVIRLSAYGFRKARRPSPIADN